MNRFYLFLISLFFLTAASANQAKQEFSPGILVINKDHTGVYSFQFKDPIWTGMSIKQNNFRCSRTSKNTHCIPFKNS